MIYLPDKNSILSMSCYSRTSKTCTLLTINATTGYPILMKSVYHGLMWNYGHSYYCWGYSINLINSQNGNVIAIATDNTINNQTVWIINSSDLTLSLSYRYVSS